MGATILPLARTALAADGAPLFKISLAEWSLNKQLKAGTVQGSKLSINALNGGVSVDNAKVFATIRDILENEAVITVVDPRPTGKPGQVVVRSKNPNCRPASSPPC